ncbi:hypothetical protein IFM89_022408 [Coptis chinensis]|uniref:Uncharacterized protein n=1 Tax=Coptis chinensis TaxID=261450 RepID=A0A835I4P4_9MAGN|nr:hypothetical protein IFM89_022408 [Coptis chinensis]
MEDRLEKAGFEFDAEIVEKRCFKVGDSALRPRLSLRKQRRLWLQKQVMTNQGTSGENEEGNEKEDVAAPRRFVRLRREYQTPWLFFFVAIKDGYCSGQIHAFDTSLDQWHKINCDILKGVQFSIATIGEDVYVVGDCSSLKAVKMAIQWILHYS